MIVERRIRLKKLLRLMNKKNSIFNISGVNSYWKSILLLKLISLSLAKRRDTFSTN